MLCVGILTILAVLGVIVLWITFGHATYQGIWKQYFSNTKQQNIELMFVLVFWPFVVFAYAIGRAYGILFGKKK